MKALRLLLVFAILAAPSCMPALQVPDDNTHAGQAASPGRPASQAPENFRGVSEYETLQGAVSSLETILKLDSTLGYDFNRHAEIFAGIPLYFVPDSGQSQGGNQLSGAGAGDVYFGGALYAPGRLVSASTTFTLAAPTGDARKGFSTGHRTIDWTNRLRAHLRRLTPFVSLGLSNTVPDTDLVTRSFSSFGNVVHMEEGAEYQPARHVYAGGSAYHVIPFGPQQVVDRTGDDRGGNNDSPQATADASSNLTRENGVDAWLGFEPSRTLRMELGYSRSVTFAVNRLSFNVGVNVGWMVRAMQRH